MCVLVPWWTGFALARHGSLQSQSSTSWEQNAKLCQSFHCPASVARVWFRRLSRKQYDPVAVAVLSFCGSLACGRQMQTLQSRWSPHAGHEQSLRRVQQRSSLTAHAARTKEGFRTFTNPQGQVLRPAGDRIYAAERPFRWFGIDVGGCSAVVKLKDGSLWVHSPVQLDQELKDALKPIGDLKHVATPNFEHTAFAPQWVKEYAGCRAYGPPGMREKKPDVGYIEIQDNAPEEWLGEIEVAFLSYEKLPLLGKPFFNELIFLHKPSKTLITTDFFWNYPATGIEGGTRAFKFGMDKIYRPVYQTILIADRGRYNEVLDRVFNKWDWDRILPCHGNLVESGGKARLRHDLSMKE